MPYSFKNINILTKTLVDHMKFVQNLGRRTAICQSEVIFSRYPTGITKRDLLFQKKEVYYCLDFLPAPFWVMLIFKEPHYWWVFLSLLYLFWRSFVKLCCCSVSQCGIHRLTSSFNLRWNDLKIVLM